MFKFLPVLLLALLLLACRGTDNNNGQPLADTSWQYHQYLIFSRKLLALLFLMVFCACR